MPNNKKGLTHAFPVTFLKKKGVHSPVAPSRFTGDREFFAFQKKTCLKKGQH